MQHGYLLLITAYLSKKTKKRYSLSGARFKIPLYDTLNEWHTALGTGLSPIHDDFHIFRYEDVNSILDTCVKRRSRLRSFKLLITHCSVASV